MNTEEIGTGLAAASRQPNGRAKAERLELLAAYAKTAEDRGLEARVLLALINAYEYGGERERLPIAFGRLLKIYDEFPAELGRFTHTIHWQLKWMTFALVRNPAVPLASAHKWLDEFESRYRQRGYSARPVWALRSILALQEGDEAAANAAMEASIAAPRDSMADCEACERNDWGYWRSCLGDDEDACRQWEPVISGRLRCIEEPARVLAMALMPLARLGRTDEARSAHLRGYPLARGNISLRKSIGYHLEFCALSGNEARGLEILTEHKSWLKEGPEDVDQRLQFATGAVVLLQRLEALGLGGTQVGTDTVEDLRAALSSEVDEICRRYDSRNGNTVVGDRTARRLAQEPFAEWLPLGLSAKLPEAAPKAAVPPAAVSLDQQIDEAARLTRQRHPHAVRAWLRVAKSADETGTALPESASAEIDRCRAQKLMATDPAAARRAFLEVAERFARIPDPGSALRARSLAVRALTQLGDVPAAQTAAQAIADEGQAAFEAEEITGHEYLIARRAPLLVGYDALARRNDRPGADIDALIGLVEAEVQAASRLGDAGMAASHHELLAQLAYWKQDEQSASDHLDSAIEQYVAAEQPWFAAGPAGMLAQLRLSDDAAQAERYTRRAVELGAAVLEPDRSAQLSSLLVEAISRQKGRESDLIDAALRASARWQGISEPDELHMAFTAARAYHVQGRHSEAVTLFAELMPRVEIPYDKRGIAMTRKTYGDSLSALQDYENAAEQLLLAADLFQDEPADKLIYAQVSWSAAEALAACGGGESAVTAYEKAAELWRELGALVPQVRCRRSIAWLRFRNQQPDQAVALMQEITAELQEAAKASASAETTAELAETEKQLDRMLKNTAARRRTAPTPEEGEEP